MIIAVASGKGGTGKTTLSAALAEAAQTEVTLLDCDVEEPNAHIFIKAQDKKREPVSLGVPVIDNGKCTLCGKCGEICEFNAIAVLKSEVLIFEELCHSCGGCSLVCPEGAVSEKPNDIGAVFTGKTGNITLIEGALDVGRSLSPPIIRAVKKHILPDKLNIIDCPPGTACPAVTSMNGADYIVLVTEATPFGLHDLKLSVDVVRELHSPYGVIINRADTGDGGVHSYCESEGIDILMEIPENMEIAKAYSRGETLLSALPQMKDELRAVLAQARGAQ